MRKLSFEPLHLLRLRRDNLIEELQQMLGNGVEGYIEHLVTQSQGAALAERELQKRMEFQEQRHPQYVRSTKVEDLAKVCREIGEGERHELANLYRQRVMEACENPS